MKKRVNLARLEDPLFIVAGSLQGKSQLGGPHSLEIE